MNRIKTALCILMALSMVGCFLSGCSSQSRDNTSDEAGREGLEENPFAREIECAPRNMAENFDVCVMILERNDNSIVTAPYNYDGDNPEAEGLKKDEILAADARFYEWSLTLRQTSEGTDAEAEYRKLTNAEAGDMIDSSAATAFVWYNREREISKVVFYGSTVYYE